MHGVGVILARTYLLWGKHFGVVWVASGRCTRNGVSVYKLR